MIHRAHEHIQLTALDKEKCDGLFIHPVVGKKKTGDYNSTIIINSYEIMQNEFYTDNKTLFGVFSTYSRYAGEREAVFTALCRKNYGCSHFIIGRDHTGVGKGNNNTHDIFSQFPDIGIEIVKFGAVYYSKEQGKYIEETREKLSDNIDGRMTISGTEARQMFNEKKAPPKWYMRPEISKMIIDSLIAKEEVFIK